jgi:hypothetical protein
MGVFDVVIGLLFLDYSLGFVVFLVGAVLYVSRRLFNPKAPFRLALIIMLCGVVQVLASLPYLLNTNHFAIFGHAFTFDYTSYDLPHDIAGVALVAVALIAGSKSYSSKAKTDKQSVKTLLLVLVAGVIWQLFALASGVHQQTVSNKLYSASQQAIAASMDTPVYQSTVYPDVSSPHLFGEFETYNGLPYYLLIVNDGSNALTGYRLEEFNSKYITDPTNFCPSSPDQYSSENPQWQNPSTYACLALGVVTGSTLYGYVAPNVPNTPGAKLNGLSIHIGQTQIIIVHVNYQESFSQAEALQLAKNLKLVSTNTAIVNQN